MAHLRRTTHRSVSGTKLYALRDSNGRFVAILTFKEAHAVNLRHRTGKRRDRGKGTDDTGPGKR